MHKWVACIVARWQNKTQRSSTAADSSKKLSFKQNAIFSLKIFYKLTENLDGMTEWKLRLDSYINLLCQNYRDVLVTDNKHSLEFVKLKFRCGVVWQILCFIVSEAFGKRAHFVTLCKHGEFDVVQIGKVLSQKWSDLNYLHDFSVCSNFVCQRANSTACGANAHILFMDSSCFSICAKCDCGKGLTIITLYENRKIKTPTE